jgi:hypothetical protein
MMSSIGFVDSLVGFPWFAWIAIVAIICGSISQIITQCHRHFERMEMIRHGMNPDSKNSEKPEKWHDAEV